MSMAKAKDIIYILLELELINQVRNKLDIKKSLKKNKILVIEVRLILINTNSMIIDLFLNVKSKISMTNVKQN